MNENVAHEISGNPLSVSTAASHPISDGGSLLL
jgi:hypothetical protein